MPSKHTPGPWEAGDLEPFTDGGATYVYADKAPEGKRLPAIALEPNSETNARLIAAAPDLLEACKGMLKERGLDGHQHSGMAIVWKDKARAAIAKAGVIQA